MTLFKLKHLMKGKSDNSEISPVNSFAASFKGNHSSLQSRVWHRSSRSLSHPVNLLSQTERTEVRWVVSLVHPGLEVWDPAWLPPCRPGRHGVVCAACCAPRQCLPSGLACPLIIFRGRKDSSSSVRAWCHLRTFCFVYLLLKGQRLNIQYPQLSAGNKHLAAEEEGGCDLERNPCVGGMTPASSVDPDLHAKGAWSDEETQEGKCVWSFWCSVWTREDFLIDKIKIIWSLERLQRHKEC